MEIISRKIRIEYYTIECPECGQEYIVLAADLESATIRCRVCRSIFDTEDWPCDNGDEITIAIGDGDVTVVDD
jgi:ribosomal protein S27E